MKMDSSLNMSFQSAYKELKLLPKWKKKNIISHSPPPTPTTTTIGLYH